VAERKRAATSRDARAAHRAQEFKAAYQHVPAKFHDTMFDVYCQARARRAAVCCCMHTPVAPRRADVAASPRRPRLQSVMQLRTMALVRVTRPQHRAARRPPCARLERSRFLSAFALPWRVCLSGGFREDLR
jgi:hypothetical protein